MLVDVSVIVRHDAGTGIQRVVRALGEQLRLSEQSGYRVRFVRASKNLPFRYADETFLTGRRDFSIGRWLVRPRRGDIFLGLDLSSRLLPSHARKIARWRRRGVKIVLMIYDLLPLEHPEWFEDRHAVAFRIWLDFVATHCDHAICISDTVRRKLVDWLERTHPDSATRLKASALPLGGDLLSARPSAAALDDAEAAILGRAQENPFVMVIGTIEPRKGHSDLLDAFDILFQPSDVPAPALVIVGRPGWKTEELQRRIRGHPEFGRRLFWFDNASDNLLDGLYRHAAGVIVPSHAEGFGLPLAEAAMHSKKILARDLPVFREHDLPGVTYFEGGDAARLAGKIDAWFRGEHSQSSARPMISWKASSDQLFGILRTFEPADHYGQVNSSLAPPTKVRTPAGMTESSPSI